MTAHQVPAAMQDVQRHNTRVLVGRGDRAGPEVRHRPGRPASARISREDQPEPGVQLGRVGDLGA
jgi:hypothetical protein